MLWRPRTEWDISERPVYPALITKAEAESILADLATRASARGRKVGETAKPKEFLLAGILQTPDGIKYQGDGRSVAAKIARLADVVATTGNATLVGKLEELERQRDALQSELASGADRAKLKARLESFTPAHVHAMLEFFPVSPKANPEAMRRTIQALVRHITLDPKPAARTVQVEYLFAVTPPRSAAAKFGGLARWEVPQKAAKQAVGFGVASPRGFEPLLPP